MADLAQWGELLQGIGAGFSGQGTQYMRAKQQQQEQQFLNDERRTKALNHDFAVAHQLGAAGQWDAVDKFLEQRKGFINKLDGDPYHTDGLQQMARDPAKREAFLNETLPYAASMAMDSSGQANPFQKGASFIVKDQANQMFQGSLIFDPNTGEAKTILSPIGHNNPQQGAVSMVGSAGMTPDESIINAGEKAAAQQNAQYQYAAPIAGAQAQARANVEAATAPKIAADTTAAQEKAKADVGRDTQSRITERSGRALNAAADLVMAAFEDVNTGPVWGRVPAAMRDATAYQTAEGAAGQYRAQMRKIIRPPGSGPWTDLDEQKLDQIVPNLQDTREAVAAKIAQGRALYDAQVGGAHGNASNAPRETPRRRSTDQQAPAAIKFLGFE